MGFFAIESNTVVLYKSVHSQENFFASETIAEIMGCMGSSPSENAPAADKDDADKNTKAQSSSSSNNKKKQNISEEDKKRLADTNMENYGSKEHRQLRKDAAGKEEAWVNMDKGEGTQIWRIEKFKVVPWPKSKYGQFHTGKQTQKHTLYTLSSLRLLT